MPGAKYGIVKWYLKKRGMDYDNWQDGKTRDKVEEESVEDFFDNFVMDFAIGKAETKEKAETLRYLRDRKKFAGKSKDILRKDSSFQTGIDEFFNERLREIVDKSRLPGDRKDRLKRMAGDYNEKDKFREKVRGEIEDWREEVAERRTEKIRARRERSRGRLESMSIEGIMSGFKSPLQREALRMARKGRATRSFARGLGFVDEEGNVMMSEVNKEIERLSSELEEWEARQEEE